MLAKPLTIKPILTGFVSCLLIVLTSGCGAKPAPLPELHAVTGQLVRQGAPVAGGFLSFKAVDTQAAPMVNAQVDQDGKFRLMTIPEGGTATAGVPAGKYMVTYSPPALDQNNLPVTLAQPIEIQASTTQITVDLGGAK